MPEQVDEPVGADQVARVEEKDAEDAPFLTAAAEFDRRSVLVRLEGAEQSEVHNR